MNLNTLSDCTQEVMRDISPKQIQTPSILDNLKRRKLQREEELSRINAAIDGLEAHPSVLKVLELIAKA